MTELATAYHDDGTQAIIETATRAAEPQRLEPDAELYSVIVPEGGVLEVVDVKASLARHQDQPARAHGTYRAATVQSFLDVVGRHEGENLTIWVHPTNGHIVGVLNDHGAGQAAQWGDHRVNLQLLATEEWTRWLSHDGKLMSQESFAEHIQDGLSEIADPPGAELLEIAQTMQGNVGVAWKSGVRLADGQVQMGYAETTDATAGRDGNLAIPTEFTLVMAPFIGENAGTHHAHLRWRIKSGQLSIGYKLDNPQRFLRDALDRVAERVAARHPNVVFFGEPRN